MYANSMYIIYSIVSHNLYFQIRKIKKFEYFSPRPIYNIWKCYTFLHSIENKMQLTIFLLFLHWKCNLWLYWILSLQLAELFLNLNLRNLSYWKYFIHFIMGYSMNCTIKTTIPCVTIVPRIKIFITETCQTYFWCLYLQFLNQTYAATNLWCKCI